MTWGDWSQRREDWWAPDGCSQASEGLECRRRILYLMALKGRNKTNKQTLKGDRFQLNSAYIRKILPKTKSTAGNYMNWCKVGSFPSLGSLSSLISMRNEDTCRIRWQHTMSWPCCGGPWPKAFTETALPVGPHLLQSTFPYVEFQMCTMWVMTDGEDTKGLQISSQTTCPGPHGTSIPCASP